MILTVQVTDKVMIITESSGMISRVRVTDVVISMDPTLMMTVKITDVTEMLRLCLQSPGVYCCFSLVFTS